MNGKQLKILGVVTTIIVLGAIWITTARKPSSGQPDAAFFPHLNSQLDKVQNIKITKAGDALATELVRTESGWAVKQRDDYPADLKKVNALLISLADAKVVEAKTSTPANYPLLGVQDVANADATGVQLELTGAEPPFKTLIGKTEATANGTYVRVADQAQSWLISQQLTVPTESNEWLQRDLLDIDASRVQAVHVQISGGATYSALKEKRGDANFDVIPIPKKRELNSVQAANSLGQALVGLQLDDVRPIDSLSAKSSAQASFHTFDGTIIDIVGYTIDDKHWLTVKARFDDALAQRFHVSTAATQPDTSLQSALASGRALAESLNKRTAAWAFAVEGYKYDAIFKPIDQLLKKT
jgi:Domain of unknown function (DUF4340)